MAFRVPTFNLTANIWRGNPVPPPVGAPALAGVPCQLAWDVAADVTFVSGLNFRHVMKVRFPAGTDVRGVLSATNQDLAEVPAGSGRFYTLWNVDDVGKGFPNEYRQALALPAAQPTPLP
jgi:hypothetical protein